MIDHLTLKVSDYRKSKDFYVKALAPLGYAPVMEFPNMGGFGAQGKPDLWLSQDPENTRVTHVAFRARDRPAVDAFYAAALSAGGRDNGPPGIRTDYHPNYYGAFVLDPDGHNVEAVCHEPARAARPVRKKARPAGKRARAKRRSR
jgi:catechol 2,3-dioxygenase-like lactoylglutathione lyase family enzyme